MGNLQFLLILLPDLDFDRSPEMGLDEVRFFLRLNLSSGQMREVSSLYNLYDIENLRAHLLLSPMVKKGGISHNELLEKFTEDEFFLGFPTLARATDPERRAHAHTLVHDFLLRAPTDSAFLKAYFLFEHNARHAIAFLRAQQLGVSYPAHPEGISFELSDTDKWPQPYAALPQILHEREQSPRNIEVGIARWKFRTIETLCENSTPFSIDYLLAYLIRLYILESRGELQSAHHLNTLQRMAKASQQL